MESPTKDLANQFERLQYEGKDGSDRFRLPFQKRDYQRQYYHIYSARLEALRQRVIDTVKRYSPEAVIKRLSDLDTIEEGESVVVIGTLFKNQILKPSILKEVGEETAIDRSTPDSEIEELDEYIDKSDELVLEDELQRARLHFGSHIENKFRVDQFVTGIVCGVLGSLIPTEVSGCGGKFLVEDMYFPDFPRQNVSHSSKDKYVAFVSGLGLSGSTGTDCLGALELASEWLTGEAGETEDQANNSKIVKLVIAGNSLAAETKDKNILRTAKYLTSGQTAKSIEAVTVLDDILEKFASGVDVDLMPGENDPANQNLPQQPLHGCLFPKSRKFLLETVPNPHIFQVDGHSFLGTSGQNIDDIIKNSDMKNPLDAMEALLRWSHIAPTCPDTLGCFPFCKMDPFVIDELPRIMFVGNQDTFGTRELELRSTNKLARARQVLLISLPKFSQCKTMVLLNLKTMKCEPINFEFI